MSMNVKIKEEMTKEEWKIQGVTVTFSLEEISFGGKRCSFVKLTTSPFQNVWNLYWDTYIYYPVKVVVNAYSDPYDPNVHPLVVECAEEIFVNEGFVLSTDDEPSFLLPQPNDEKLSPSDEVKEKVHRVIEKMKITLKDELNEYFNTEYTDRGVTPPQVTVSILCIYRFYHRDGELSGCLNLLENPTSLLELISNLPCKSKKLITLRHLISSLPAVSYTHDAQSELPRFLQSLSLLLDKGGDMEV
ncbi:MAG: hypothetical protein QW687_05080 [Candidatus Hadarchaeales archaeon]